MKLSTTRTHLLPAVKRAASIADGKMSPNLAGVLLRASDRLEIVATDLTVDSVTAIPAKVAKGGAGAVVVDAAKFAAIVDRLPDGEIKIATTTSKDGAESLEIAAGRVNVTLAVVVAGVANFPNIADMPEAMVDVKPEAIAQILAAVAPAICHDESRFHLVGALLEAAGATLRAVATDGHRLIVAEHDVGKLPAIPAGGVIVPRDGVAAIRALVDIPAGGVIVPRDGVAAIRALVDGADGCRVGLDGRGRIFVERIDNDDTSLARLCVKLIDAAFPPYGQVIPTHKASITLDRAALADAIRRGALMSSETRGISLAIAGSTLTVSAHHADIGEVVEEIDVESTLTARLTIGAAPKYLADALGATDADEVRLEFGGALEPIAIRPVGDEGLIAVVMPMRI